MRKRYLLIAGVLLPLTAGILFLWSHPTDYRYNDWWVIGRHMEEIEDRYGAPDLGAYRNGSAGRVGYYIYTDHGSLFRIISDIITTSNMTNPEQRRESMTAVSPEDNQSALLCGGGFSVFHKFHVQNLYIFPKVINLSLPH